MKYARELLTAGLLTAAVAGCGGNKAPHHKTQINRPPVPAPLNYDVSNVECDPAEAILGISGAIKNHKPLIIKGLDDRRGANYEESYQHDVVTNLNNDGPEIIDPAVVMCDGAVKYVFGIDRGFTGKETPQIVQAEASETTFSLVSNNKNWNQAPRISLKELSKYVVTATLRDPGPAPAGVSGLTTLGPLVYSFSAMP